MKIIAFALFALPVVSGPPAHGASQGEQAGFGVQLELAGRFAYTETDEGIGQKFVLPRTRVSLMADDGQAISGRFVLAAVRSTPETGYLGVDGEALITRIDAAEGRVHWRKLGLSLAAGVLSNPWIDRRNDRWTWQAVQPTVAEAQGFMARADLGFELRWHRKDELISAWIQGHAGEGHRFRERNGGQSVIGVIRLRPLGFSNRAWARYVEVSLMGLEGSVGAASARNHRFGGRLAAGDETITGGVEWIKALGQNGDPVPEPWALSVWAETNPWRALIGYARFDLVELSPHFEETHRHTFDVGIGVQMPYEAARPDRQGRLSLGYRLARADEQATPVAGAAGQESTHMVFAQLTLDFGLTFSMPPENLK
ncbi:MAG: hypothetical protein VX589_06045 [Myxococcota bacterium]|nr:hypothetical protein [Myxococcota bacterium]